MAPPVHRYPDRRVHGEREMSKTLGEMTPQERDATVKRAVSRFQSELDRTAPAIGKVLDSVAGEEGCTFVSTDGRRCVLHQSHKGPRKRKGHYVTYGECGDGHLLAGEQACKWGDADA